MTPETFLGSGGEGGAGSFMRFIYSALAMMGGFITAFDKHDRIRDKFQMDTQEAPSPTIETYDFIIVGGGTAGLIVANRLSDKYRVLVVEAGGEAFPLQSIPSLSPYMMNRKEIDWMFKSLPQKYACQALRKQRTNICQGKGLGGSSNMGSLNYLRGSPFDYEYWANVTDNPEWKYSNLLPYFRRIENYQGKWDNAMLHGSDGEVQLQTPNYTGMATRFINAGIEMNYKMSDLNGFFAQGFDNILSPLRRGYRQTSATAYLNNIRPKPRLDIRKFAEVQKILFRHEAKNNSNPTAYGIVYSRHGSLVMAVATKEIILSAGAVNTPKLLMLSGIGHAKVLESINVPLIKDLPVGDNLQDHLITYLGPFMLNTTSNSFLLDRDLTAETIAQFGLIDGQGPLTSTGIHANAILTSSQQKMKGNLMWPDLHLSLYGMSHHSSMNQEFVQLYNIQKEVAEAYFTPTVGMDSFSIIISGGRPRSRGRVSLPPNATISSPPLINPKYFSDPNDMEVMLDGIYRALSLVENSAAFQSIGATLFPVPFPSCEAYEFRSKSYWTCYLRHFSMSGNNLVGSCAMASASTSESTARPDGVVDGELKVFGVDRLRVIDASVMPSITVGGTLAPTMLIAEKGADMLRNFWDRHEFQFQQIPTGPA